MSSEDPATTPLKNTAKQLGVQTHIPHGYELKAWTEKWQLEDKWWYTINETIFGPSSIAEIEDQCKLLLDKKIMVIHVITTENPNMKWITMDATPLETADTPQADPDSCKITQRIRLRYTP